MGHDFASCGANRHQPITLLLTFRHVHVQPEAHAKLFDYFIEPPAQRLHRFQCLSMKCADLTVLFPLVCLMILASSSYKTPHDVINACYKSE